MATTAELSALRFRQGLVYVTADGTRYCFLQVDGDKVRVLRLSDSKIGKMSGRALFGGIEPTAAERRRIQAAICG